jgi:hypothetical protein
VSKLRAGTCSVSVASWRSSSRSSTFTFSSRVFEALTKPSYLPAIRRACSTARSTFATQIESVPFRMIIRSHGLSVGTVVCARSLAFAADAASAGCATAACPAAGATA